MTSNFDAIFQRKSQKQLFFPMSVHPGTSRYIPGVPGGKKGNGYGTGIIPVHIPFTKAYRLFIVQNLYSSAYRVKSPYRHAFSPMSVHRLNAKCAEQNRLPDLSDK